MASALSATPNATDRLSVPRRSLGLMPLLVSRVCERTALPSVLPEQLTPVRSMFDYDLEAAIPLGPGPIRSI